MSFTYIASPLTTEKVSSVYLTDDGLVLIKTKESTIVFSIFDREKTIKLKGERNLVPSINAFSTLENFDRAGFCLALYNFEESRLLRKISVNEISEKYGFTNFRIDRTLSTKDNILMGVANIGILVLDLSLDVKRSDFLLFDDKFAMLYSVETIIAHSDLSYIAVLVFDPKDDYMIIVWKNMKERFIFNPYMTRKDKVSIFSFFGKYIAVRYTPEGENTIKNNEFFLIDASFQNNNHIKFVIGNSQKIDQVYFAKDKFFLLNDHILKECIIEGTDISEVSTICLPRRGHKDNFYSGICYSLDMSVFHIPMTIFDDTEVVRYDSRPYLEENKLNFTKWWISNNEDSHRDLLGRIMEFLTPKPMNLRIGDIWMVRGRRGNVVDVPSILYSRQGDLWTVLALPIDGKSNPFAGRLFDGIGLLDLKRCDESSIKEDENERALRKQAQRYIRSTDPDTIRRVKLCCRREGLKDIECSRALRRCDMSIYQAALLLESVAGIESFERENFVTEDDVEDDSESNASDSGCEANDLVSLPSF